MSFEFCVFDAAQVSGKIRICRLNALTVVAIVGCVNPLTKNFKTMKDLVYITEEENRKLFKELPNNTALDLTFGAKGVAIDASNPENHAMLLRLAEMRKTNGDIWPLTVKDVCLEKSIHGKDISEFEACCTLCADYWLHKGEVRIDSCGGIDTLPIAHKNSTKTKACILCCNGTYRHCINPYLLRFVENKIPQSENNKE